MELDKQQVYAYLQTIPTGRVATYGQIAEHFGDKSLARTVGNILHQNPDGDRYPCYKVVDSKGRLSEQYTFGGIRCQKERLERDGIQVINNRVDLRKYGM